MKQENLFSFFKKISPKSKTPNSSVAATHRSKPTAPSSQDTKTNAAVVGRNTSKSPVVANTQFSKVKVNMKIAVLWPDDNQYYAAIVAKERQDGKHFLEYEDGEKEWIDLRHEKLRFIDNDLDLEEDEEPEEDPAGSNVAKKRPWSDDSDEEFEMDDASEEDDEDGEMEYAAEEEETDKRWLASSEGDEQWDARQQKERVRKQSNKKPKVTQYTVFDSSHHSATKVTPRLSCAPSSSTPSGATVTPKSLELFSAHSASKESTSALQRVSPPSLARLAGATTEADGETWDGERALPYRVGETNPAGSHVHHHLKFLQNLKDANGRSPEQLGYSPRTLKVDKQELLRHYSTGKQKKELSPGVDQWWNVKSQYFDTVLLFKTGKFYEMFHMDCDIGVQVCGLQYMKGHVAHCGFPEISYGPMADKLVRAGYKVARVEQTETPEMLTVRKKNTVRGKPKPKVVNREVCSIMTMGTRTHCYLDGDLTSDFCAEDSGTGPLLVIREVKMGVTGSQQGPDSKDAIVPACEYGIVVVDAARGAMTMGQFCDDVLRSRMVTLLATFNPSEVLLEGGQSGASTELRALLRSAQLSAKFRIEDIQTDEEFPSSYAVDMQIRQKLERHNGKAKPWNVQETLEELHRREYFPRASKQEQTLSISRWPKVLQCAVEGGAELALSSLGAALFYLQRNLIDEDIFSMGLVTAYVPPACPIVEAKSKLSMISQSANEGVEVLQGHQPTVVEGQDFSKEDTTTHMSLDGNTLVQLEILTNSMDNKREGSLSWFIDYTRTPHGARLLRAWLLRPLFQKADIDRRADAVEELLSGKLSIAMMEASALLSKCGDIERLVSTIHAQSGGAKLPEEEKGRMIHPNTRAVLYEMKTYTKRKVGNFSKVLSGLRSASQIPEVFAGIQICSGLLQKLVRSTQDNGGFPDISEHLDWFEENLDLEKAAMGEFEPGRGVDAVFDDAVDEISSIHLELERYKDEMCSTVLKGNAKNVWKYVNTGQDSKDKFTIELPKHIEVPSDFKMIGKRGSGVKQVNKYRTPIVEDLVKALEHAIDVHKERKAIQLQLIFARFGANRHLWSGVSIATATLDALSSLAELGKKPGYCRPKILECPLNSNPCINIVQGRHPCVEKTFGGEFIPNDLALGSQVQGEYLPMVLLLSGPNMGGKSTLLRQTCLICILAQIGAMVPAESCSLTPMDVIMTRLGASDRILMGQSTFFVELAETAAALRGATRRSLILFDELGRGTSSFDGTAIASACLSYICSSLKCLSLFATHYHSLLEEKKNATCVRLAHMESTVNEQEEETDNITFLYTLGDGPCPKSFGINVARLARLPEEVLEKAARFSSDFELEMNGDTWAAKQRRDLTELIEAGDVNMDEIEKIWGLMKSE